MTAAPMQPLQSDRLRLRPLGPGDEALYCRLYTDPVLMRHVAAPLDEAAAQRSFRTACRQAAATPAPLRIWIVRDAPRQQDVGLVALAWREGQPGAEIGAMILTDAHRRGYAGEAMGLLVEHAFRDLEVPMLWGHHPSRNGASTGLMDKLGFARVPPTHPQFDHRWELSRTDWFRTASGP